jgi:adenine-specific DNA-methyltransferase
LKDENGAMREMKPLSIMVGPYNQEGTKDIAELFGTDNVFPFPKPMELIRFIVSLTINDHKDQDAIVLDFFAGSGTLGHAVVEQNLRDSGQRRYILVQAPVDTPSDSPANKAGFKKISELTAERLRRVGKKIKDANPLFIGDTGFRKLRIDTSSMQNVYYTPDETSQQSLLEHVDNIKPDRTPEDLLFQVLLDWGVDLASPIASETVDGKQVFFVDGNALAACVDFGLTDEFVKKIAERKPLRAVFRDASYSSDAAKINVEQIFKFYSPETELKCL